jgi:hypothetical protein
LTGSAASGAVRAVCACTAAQWGGACGGHRRARGLLENAEHSPHQERQEGRRRCWAERGPGLPPRLVPCGAANGGTPTYTPLGYMGWLCQLGRVIEVPLGAIN